VLGAISEAVTATTRVIRQRQMKWFAGAGGGLAAVFALLLFVEFVARSRVA
jgi:uncharacterized protein involved in exopolysaccharide biosynthesis